MKELNINEIENINGGSFAEWAGAWAGCRAAVASGATEEGAEAGFALGGPVGAAIGAAAVEFGCGAAGYFAGSQV